MKTLALAGATGVVGAEILSLLESSRIPFERLRCFASARSAEAKVTVRFRDETICVEDIARVDFREIDMMISSIGSKAIRVYGPRARESGCTVIDNSSAFRLDADVPLVVPEINRHALSGHSGLIANPNCTTAIALMALFPLHKTHGVTRVSATTYQAASGAGGSGLAELRAELNSWASDTHIGEWRQKRHDHVFPHPIVLNVFPQVGTIGENGFSDEEMKLTNEGRKILGHPGLKVSTTCVRVPVERVHCVDILAECESPIDLDSVNEALSSMPGLDFYPDAAYPTPLMLAGKHACAVGRVRLDAAFENAVRFWVAGDQLLKGAALNAVQIAEALT